MTRWFEDIELGQSWDMGSHTFTLEDIKRFGASYDPQYFHTDEDAAAHAQFGGIIASGWHTACVGHRKLVDALAADSEQLVEAGEQPGEAGPSPGVNSMIFKAPVRPGDTVHYELTILSKRASQSLPGWGLLIQQIEATNQTGEMVYRAEIAGFIKMRDYRYSLGQRLAIWAMGVPVLRRLIKA